MTRFIKISSPGCQPCKVLDIIVTELKKEFPDVVFESYDSLESCYEYVTEYKIKSVPTVLIFQGKNSVPVVIRGLKSKDFYVETLEQLK